MSFVIKRLRALVAVLILIFPYIAFFLPAQDEEDGELSGTGWGVTLMPRTDFTDK
ncbi:MAG: hypothetical protein IKN72_11340 [Clostridia bacterium]|nr:hypothetical protein [Clostridia bacterium]MBR3553959.1 hypothetical protein [Clostridia bacterium]